jgi:hypothetical protein
MTTTSNSQVSSITQIRALHDRYIVEGNAGFYVVNGACCCDDAINRAELLKGHCKHRLAALLSAEEASQESKPKATRKVTADSPRDEELEAKVNDLYR